MPASHNSKPVRGPFSRFADATDNQRLFQNTYWGNFREGPNATTITPAIVENRNRFAVEYDLREAVGLTLYPYTPPGSDFDHMEVYRDGNGEIVAVCSNYNGPPPSFLGMRPLYPIYSTGTRSYVARFANVKEMRQRFGAQTMKGA